MTQKPIVIAVTLPTLAPVQASVSQRGHCQKEKLSQKCQYHKSDTQCTGTVTSVSTTMPALPAWTGVTKALVTWQQHLQYWHRCGYHRNTGDNVNLSSGHKSRSVIATTLTPWLCCKSQRLWCHKGDTDSTDTTAAVSFTAATLTTSVEV